MGNYAVPAKHGDSADFDQYDTAVTPSKYDFQVVSGVAVADGAASESGDVVGIATKDERDGTVEVYHGTRPVIMAGTAANTLAIHDEVYVGAVNEVFGEPEAALNAVSIGKVISVNGLAIKFAPHWFYNRTGADAA